jgi:hypothetical protein
MNYNKKYLITKSKSYVYFRVPKCATRTILYYLHQHTQIEFGFPRYTKLNTGRNIRYDKSWDDLLKFAFVRNPWERLVSAYIDKIQGDSLLQGSQLKNYKKKYNTFNKMVQFIKSAKLEELNEHFNSQINLLPLNKLDFIGKFENLQEDFNIICDKIKIPRQKLPHQNKSKHKHYTEYYDDETRAIVAEKYRKDIEYFGYDFGD